MPMVLSLLDPFPGFLRYLWTSLLTLRDLGLCPESSPIYALLLQPLTLQQELVLVCSDGSLPLGSPH